MSTASSRSIADRVMANPERGSSPPPFPAFQWLISDRSCRTRPHDHQRIPSITFTSILIRPSLGMTILNGYGDATDGDGDGDFRQENLENLHYRSGQIRCAPSHHPTHHRSDWAVVNSGRESSQAWNVIMSNVSRLQGTSAPFHAGSEN